MESGIALSSTLSHPPYLEMITDAITTLKEQNGSSNHAISKFIQHKHNKALPLNFKSLLSHHLKKFVKSQKLCKVKNSYKIYETNTNTGNTNANTKNIITVTTTVTTPPKRKGGMEKMKSLSQVKTPEALKKKSVAVTSSSSAVKLKPLSQVVMTPEGIISINHKPVKSSRPTTRKGRK